MYLADYHLHSNCSPDGKLTMAQVAEEAVRRGLDEICFTDHLDTIYWVTNAPRTDFDWEKAQSQFREAQERFGDRLVMKLGVELGEANLSFERAEILLKNAPVLDFCIGSVHTMSEKMACKDLYYLEEGSEASYRETIEDYLESELKLARWGKFNVMGHLTLPLRYLKEHLRVNLDFEPWMDRVEEIFREIIPKGVGIECNTNRGNEPLPYERILRRYREMGGEIITLGSDAHTAQHVGCAIRERQELLKECGFTYFCTFTAGKPEFKKL